MTPSGLAPDDPPGHAAGVADAPPPQTLPTDDTGTTGRWTKRALVVTVVVLAGFWGWVALYQLTNQGERDMPDRLADLSWAPEAERICEAAHAEVADLPSAPATPSAAERADVIDDATDVYDAMLVELAAVLPSGGDPGADLVAAWLADYRVFLADRRSYAAALRTDPAARFVVTEKYGRQITAPVDRFARVNTMESCMSPGDV